MSTENVENTQPASTMADANPPEEGQVANPSDLPVESQSKPRVKRVKTKTIQAGAVESKADLTEVTTSPDQSQVIDETLPSPDNIEIKDKTTTTPLTTDEVTAVPVVEPEAVELEAAALPPSDDELPPATKVKRGKWIWLGVLIMLVLVLAGSGIGYASAMRARNIEQDNQKLILATTQFELGKADLAQGKLEIAQDRFEYVLSIYPDFPGLDEKLVEVGLLIGQSQGGNYVPTPGPEPTPTVAITVVPTKSTGSTTLLFNQAKAQLAGQDWEGLFSTLNAMREIDPAHNVIEVDGMWYITLRNRGIRLIQDGQLEPGLYSFALAEQFAPIDADAESYRTWARMYINAGSYWQVDWYKAVEGFANLYPLVPQLRDSSGINVTQRYSRALIGYGDFQQQNYDFCGAVSTYQQSAGIYSDASLPEKITQAEEYCKNPPATPTPTVDPLAPTSTPTLIP